MEELNLSHEAWPNEVPLGSIPEVRRCQCDQTWFLLGVLMKESVTLRIKIPFDETFELRSFFLDYRFEF